MKNNDEYYEDARERIDNGTINQWCEELEKENERLTDELEEVKKELSELKSKAGNFIDKHMAYPYGENGELFDDEYTKDYVELKELVGKSDE